MGRRTVARGAATALVAALAAAPQALGAGRPDLTVSKVTGAPAGATVGDAVKLGVTVRNAGRAKAKRATTVALYLSQDARLNPGDIHLGGTAKVKKLKAHKNARTTRAYTIPQKTKPGTYRLLACAD